MEKVSLDLYVATAARVFHHLSKGNAVDLDGYCLTPDDDDIVWIDRPNGSEGGSFPLKLSACEEYLRKLQNSGRSATYSVPPSPDAPLVEIDDSDDELDDLEFEPLPDEIASPSSISPR